MSTEPANDQSDTDTQSAAMTDQLRNDVSSWKAARSDESVRQTDFSVPVTRPAATKPAPRAKKAVAPAPTADSKKKPFGMSYDGTSNADYINYRISRGAR
jgi:hypothetical protein